MVSVINDSYPWFALLQDDRHTLLMQWGKETRSLWFWFWVVIAAMALWFWPSGVRLIGK